MKVYNVRLMEESRPISSDDRIGASGIPTLAGKYIPSYIAIETVTIFRPGMDCSCIAKCWIAKIIYFQMPCKLDSYREFACTEFNLRYANSSMYTQCGEDEYCIWF